MAPWDIIGWVLIIIGVVCLLFTIGGFIAGFAVRRMLHLQDRDTPPAVGQKWLTADREWPQPYEITRITEDGRIVYKRHSNYAVHSGNWSPEQFRNVIYNTGAWLQR